MNTDKFIERMNEKDIILKGPDFITRTIKKLIFTKLRELRYGQLKITDTDSQETFGEPDSKLTASIEIIDPTFYIDLFTKGSIGAAEAYILKKWESSCLEDTMAIFAANREILTQIDSGLVNFIKPVRFLEYWKQRNTVEGSKKNIVAHYDLPDELFRLFLDKSMMYSSALYPSATATLEEAQNNKMHAIAKKLDIFKGAQILEIGSGWGAMAIYLAKNYDCHVTTTTISENQYQEVARRIRDYALEDKITLLKQDYRVLSGKYDRVVSIEMIEAVGEKYLSTYLKKISDLLTSDGLMLLQAITITDQDYERAVKEVDFIKKFIFPGSLIPSLHAIASVVKSHTDMRLISQLDFAHHYAKTLSDWKNRLSNKRGELKEIGLDEAFERMWNFYFCYCIGGFRERAIGVSHLVYSKPMYRNI